MRFKIHLAAAACALLISGPSLASPTTNKATAIQAMIDMVAKQDIGVVERYFAGPYVQHNTGTESTLDGLRDLIKRSKAWKNPGAKTYRALAEGDLVVLQSIYTNLADQHDDAVAFDLFRFNKNGKIVEHWDALVPAITPIGTPHVEVAGETRITDLGKTAANRATVLAYIDAAFLKPDPKKAAALVSKAMVDHHTKPKILLNTQPGSPTDGPFRYVKVHKTVAEGNFVFVQSEGRINGDQILEIYNLYRVADGKIVEHWDVLQPVRSPDKWAKGSVPF